MPLHSPDFSPLGRNARSDPAEDEDLHVLVTGDTQEQVDAAAVIIEELLTPKEDTENEWKRMQLRELAMINGTLRDDQVGTLYTYTQCV